MLSTFCEDHIIVHELTPPYSPQSNGVAERKNRMLMDMVNAMLISSCVPKILWGEAILIACFILNRITRKDNDKTPYELWRGRTPNVRILKVRGCLAKVAILEPKRKKIGHKTVDAIFLGYAHNSTTNRFLVINSEISEISNNTIIESRDAIYFENIFPYKTKINTQVTNKPSTSSNSGPSTSSIQEQESKPIQVLRRSKRPRVEKNFGNDFYTFLVEGNPTTYKKSYKFNKCIILERSNKR